MTQAPPIETLRKNLADLIAESQALRADVKTSEAARRRESWFNLVISAIGMVAIVLVLVVAFQNRQITEQNNDLSQQIRSCTTPGGDCYKEGQARTSTAVGKILEAQLVIAECARSTTTDAALRACATKKLGG